MRNRSLILLTAMIVIVFVGVAGVYAFDRTGRGTIAEGVKIAGVDVGGLDADQARAELERGYVAQLRKPITITEGQLSFTLDATQTKAAANMSTLIDSALAQGRGDSIVTRTWRRIARRHLDVDLAPSTVYDESAASRLIDEVRSAVDSPAQDASVRFSPTGVTSEPARDGLEVRTDALREQLVNAIVDPRAPRAFTVPVKRTAPAVTTADVKRTYKTALIVNRENFTLTLYKNLEKVKTLARRRRRRRARDARRPLPHPEQGGQPGLDDAELRRGSAERSAARSCRAGRRRTRSRRAGWASSTAPGSTASTIRVRLDRTRRVARLRTDAHPRRHRAVSDRSRSARRSTSV